MASRRAASILEASASERYRYFVEAVARGGDVWALCCEAGWLLGECNRGHLVFPVWPSAAFAALVGEPIGHFPAPIRVQEWIDEWLRWLSSESIHVGVFAASEQTDGALVDPDTLRADLLESLERSPG